MDETPAQILPPSKHPSGPHLNLPAPFCAERTQERIATDTKRERDASFGSTEDEESGLTPGAGSGQLLQQLLHVDRLRRHVVRLHVLLKILQKYRGGG